MATVFRPPYSVRITVRGPHAAIGSQDGVGGAFRALLASSPQQSPFRQADHPNPRARRPLLQTFQASSPATLLATWPLIPTDWQLPPPRRVQSPTEIFGQPLTVRPAGETPKPAPTTDFPNPTTRRPQLHAGSTGATLPLLLGQDAVVGRDRNYDFANPRRPGRLNTGFSASGAPLLLVQVASIGPRNYEFPNPLIRRVQQPQQFVWSPALTAVGPLAPTDWATPPARRVQSPTEVFGQPLTLVPVAAVASPFSQAQWPNPVIRVGARQDAGTPTQLPAVHATPTVHQATTLPPVSRRQSNSPDLQDQPLTILAGLTRPQSGVALDMPVRRRAATQGHTQPAWALYVAVQAPFAQTDWQNPVRARQARQPEARETRLPAHFATPPVAASFDLPLRRGRLNPGFAQFAFIPRIPEGPKPFALTDWPNPLRARRYHTGPWGLGAAFIPATVEPDFWTPVPPTSETWVAVSQTNETWTPVPPTPSTWTEQ